MPTAQWLGAAAAAAADVAEAAAAAARAGDSPQEAAPYPSRTNSEAKTLLDGNNSL